MGDYHKAQESQRYGNVFVHQLRRVLYSEGKL